MLANPQYQAFDNLTFIDSNSLAATTISHMWNESNHFRNEIMEDYKIQRGIRQRFQALGREKDGLARQVRILLLGATEP